MGQTAGSARTLAAMWIAVAACAEPAPPPAPPGDAVVAPTAEPPLLAEPQFPYDPPEPLPSEVVRRRRRVWVKLSWTAVPGAESYAVQLSRTMTFQRNIFEQTLTQTAAVVPRLAPGIYFWRVRAQGPLGSSPFSRARVLEATAVSASKGKRRITEAGPDAETVTPSPATSTQLPLRLVWRKPNHQSVVTSNPVTIKGVATAGAEVHVNGGPPQKVTATFAIPVNLAHGRNELTLGATLGAQRKSLRRVVYWADPNKLAPIRARFEELKRQLDEIAALRSDLSKAANNISAQIKNSGDQAAVAELKAEMSRMTEIRREIDQEIGSALAEMDALLKQ